MTDKERLIEILGKAYVKADDNYGLPNVEQVADCLLEKGVIVPQCKVGDTIYYYHPQDGAEIVKVLVKSEIEEKNNEIIEFQKQIIGLLCRGISEIIKVKGDDTEWQLKNS